MFDPAAATLLAMYSLGGQQVQVLYAAELSSGVAVAGIERRIGWQKLRPVARSVRAPGRGPLRP